MSTVPPDVAVDAEHIPLDSALLCSDCSHIYRVSRAECPSCGSGAYVQLAEVLGDRNELVMALRALSKLLTLAKRSPTLTPRKRRKEKKPDEDPSRVQA